MRHQPKVKALSTRVPLRKAAMSAAALSRRPFPAWIAADDSGVAFSARTAIRPRVRDGLVLRTVAKKKSESPRHPNVHGHR
ncbi:MAG: hypothetical protein JNK23_01390 [Opitutaceae bacterium]|nr:hypothetical protein [Opitutaceae bacterium]